MPGGRPRKHPAEQRTASTRADLTLAEKEALVHEAHLHGISEAEYVRRRLGFGAPAGQAEASVSLVSELEKRGVNVAELFARDYVREQAESAGMSEAAFVRRVLEFATAPPAKRQVAALISELNACGNNVNQLARSVHRGSDFTEHWREVSAQVTAALEKVLDAHD